MNNKTLEIKPVENGWIVYEESADRGKEMIRHVFVTTSSLAAFVEVFYTEKREVSK